MKLSDLQQLLTKVQTIAGDVEVVLKDAVSEAETVITDLGIHLDPTTAQAGGTLTIEHGVAAPAAAEGPAAEGQTSEKPAAAESGTKPESDKEAPKN